MKTLLRLFLCIIIVLTSCKSNNSSFNLDLIPVQLEEDEDWGFINLKGNLKIEPDFENKPSIFNDGYALFENRKGFYDYIDRNGNIMDNSYKYATDFNEGLACIVEEKQPPIYINKNFEEEIILDQDIEAAGIFYNGLARIKNNDGKWGFINKDGEIIISPEYDFVTCFKEDLALVIKKIEPNEKLMGFINKNGDEIIELEDKLNIPE